MTSVYQLGGYQAVQGNKVFEAPSMSFDKGIKLDPSVFGKVQPKGVYTSMFKNLQVSEASSGQDAAHRISDTDWKLRRVRDNQNGLKASEQIHSAEWYPVSNIQDETFPEVPVEARQINIQSSTFRYGQAVYPGQLGRNIQGTKRVITRNPGDLLFTKSLKHNSETLNDPSGRHSGAQGVRLKM